MYREIYLASFAALALKVFDFKKAARARFISLYKKQNG